MTYRMAKPNLNNVKYLSLVCFFISFTTWARTELILGEAKNTKGDLVYTEVQTLIYEKDKVVRIESDYFLPNGEKFAEMKTDLGRSRYLPAYHYKNFRNERESGLEYLADDSQQASIFSKTPDKKEIKKKKIEIKDNMATGQGAFFYAQDNIEKLVRGETLFFRFAVPVALDTYDFRIKPLETRKDVIRLSIEIDNWFFRLFAPKVEVDYDLKKDQLIEYRGIGILFANRRPQNVVITYEKKPPGLSSAVRK